MKASVAELVKLPGVWRGGELEHALQPTIATGHAALDAELPGGGWPTGTLTEVLHDAAGIGEIALLAAALEGATAGNRMLAWINPPHLPYAPALAQMGLPLARCLVIRPASREDALWSAEQALKSGACGAVLFWLDGTLRQAGREKANEYAALRRLQMAAEAGRAMAIYFRSTAAERLSTPAHLRVVLQREDSALQVRIPKRRGPPLVKPLSLAVGYRPRRKATPHAAPVLPVAVPERARALHLVGR